MGSVPLHLAFRCLQGSQALAARPLLALGNALSALGESELGMAVGGGVGQLCTYGHARASKIKGNKSAHTALRGRC